MTGAAERNVPPSLLRPEDMPESFQVAIEAGAYRRVVVSAVQNLPGVSDVVDALCMIDKRAR